MHTCRGADAKGFEKVVRFNGLVNEWVADQGRTMQCVASHGVLSVLQLPQRSSIQYLRGVLLWLSALPWISTCRRGCSKGRHSSAISEGPIFL